MSEDNDTDYEFAPSPTNPEAGKTMMNEQEIYERIEELERKKEERRRGCLGWIKADQRKQELENVVGVDQ